MTALDPYLDPQARLEAEIKHAERKTAAVKMHAVGVPLAGSRGSSGTRTWTLPRTTSGKRSPRSAPCRQRR